MRSREYSVTRMTEAIHAQTQTVFFDAPSPRTSYPRAGGMLATVEQRDATLSHTNSATPAQDIVQVHKATGTFVRSVHLPSPRPSSEGAVTPNAPVGQARRAYRGLPSQIENGERVIIHPLLERVPDVKSIDFSQPWEIIKAAWPPSSFQELATNPPLPSLAVVVQLFPWAIVIQPAADRCYVTVGDVISWIWKGLHFPLDVGSAAPRARDNEGNSERNRIFRRGVDDARKSTQHQSKRLVYLKGRTRFMGLAKETSEGDTWVMLMA